MKKNKKNVAASPDDENNNDGSSLDFSKMKSIFRSEISLSQMQTIIQKTGELAAEGNLRAVSLVWSMYQFFSQPSSSLEKNERRDEWNCDVQKLIFPPTQSELPCKKTNRKKK